MMERIKEMWEGSTSGEKTLVVAIAVLAVFDLLGGAIFQALLGSAAALFALVKLNSEVAGDFADQFEEAWDRTGGALDDIFDDE